jgi:ferrous iron transport protein B
MKIALAGNPNCGKTTMFNNLTGSSQYVGNWPGVTVEKKEGKLKHHKDVIITDLPGIYSLSPYTLEEVVSRNYLINERPDAVINLVDATNLERNLYLTTQIVELGIPVVIALNMMDIVNKSGDNIDVKKLAEELGCEVVETCALKGHGSMEAAEKAIRLAKEKKTTVPQHTFSEPVEKALAQIDAISRDAVAPQRARWYAIKLFERDEMAAESLPIGRDAQSRIEQIILSAEKEMDDDSESIITNERYMYIGRLMEGCIQKKKLSMSTTDKIDRIVTNRVLALPIFAAVMFVVYFVSVTTVGAIVTDWTNDTLFGEWIQPGVAAAMEGAGAAPWLTGLIVDGIIGGVGAVLGFVPQMFILFFFLSMLEDCGYMARVAFIMDRIFRRFGLSGKSFIPMLISSGCAVPGIMATKTIENEKDRRMTVITTSFIPCGAKLPVIALIAGAIMGGAWWMAPLVYFIGIAAVIVTGIILKKTKMFAGPPAPFVMELPQYHLPAAKSVLIHMWERSRAFIIKAGTIIFVACGVIWFLGSFGYVDGTFGMVDADASILAVIGNAIAPVFAPLGFGDWQSSVATISGLVAKENVVGTFGVLNGIADALEDDPGLWASVAALFSGGLAAMSFLIFNMLCAPCFAAIGAIRREMMSAKWTWFAILYMTGFAYAISLLVFQLGSFFTGGAFGVGTAVAFVVLAILLYLLFRRMPERNMDAKRAHAGAGLQ